MWHEFEIDWTGLQIYIKENVILLKNEYLITSSTDEHKICRIHRIHQDVCTKEVSWPFINLYLLYKQFCLLTTNHTHIDTASHTYTKVNFELKMYVKNIFTVEIQCKIVQNFQCIYVI